MIPSLLANEMENLWLDFVEKQLQSITKDDVFYKVKMASLERLQEFGFPTKKAENYQYFPLHALFSCELGQSQSHAFDCSLLDEYILSECQGQVLVTINGIWQPHLSDLSLIPSGCVIKELSSAIKKTFSSHLQQRMQAHVKEEKDPLALMNTCLFADGVFFYIASNTLIEKPIQILHIVTSDKEDSMELFTHRMQVFISSGAQVKVVETFVSATRAKSLINNYTEITMEEGSHLHWQHVDFLKSHDYLMNARRSFLKKHAQFDGLHISLGAKAARHESIIALKGVQASAKEESLSILQDTKQSHVQLTIQHLAMHTESMQKVRSLLFDAAKIAFQGKIYVDKDGQKTNAYQRSSHLMLGEKAVAQTKPNLEIFADDVKASHGSSTARISEKELDYMRSRGISKSLAQMLLIQGFCKDSLDALIGETFKKKFSEKIHEKLWR